MKDRSMRRHQDFRAKTRNIKHYNSCIKNLSEAEIDRVEHSVDKLKKICAWSHLSDESRKKNKKPVQEMKHDITMREQMKTLS